MIELLKQPDSLMQMSIGEKLTAVLEVAGLGIGVTFVVLLLLMLSIFILTTGSRKAAAAAAAPVAAPAPVAPSAPADSSALQMATQQAALEALEREEVCAIFAAITAMEQGSPFRIVNIVPLSPSGQWVEGNLSAQFATRGSQLK